MDNGFESFEIIGPAEKLTEYTKKDHEKFKKDFDEIKENGEKIPLYKSISVGGLEYTHNIKVAKKWQCNVYTMGKSIQSGDNWFGVSVEIACNPGYYWSDGTTVRSTECMEEGWQGYPSDCMRECLF